MGCNSSKVYDDSTESKTGTQHDPRTHRRVRDDTRSEELLVAVMGYTGSGMSQFIHDLTDSYQHGVGRAECMSSTTKEIQKVEAEVSGRRITFIDTPGIDGLARDESVVFQELSAWLPRNCSPNARLAGIVYMQNMTNDAIYRAEFNPHDVNKCLKKVCGSDWHRRVVLVCSHWDEVEDPEMKESELKNGYWRSMEQKGSQMGRFGPPEDFGRAKLILSSIVPLDD